MEQATVVRLTEQTLEIKGALTFRTVMAVRSSLEAALELAVGPQQINLAGVTHADSSALSLWLCLQRWAGKHGLHLCVNEVPAELEALGHLTGLERGWSECG